MKLTTEYWIGINHVGVADQPARVMKLPVRLIILEIAKTLTNEQLATRFDMVLARTEEEVRNRLTRTTSSNPQGLSDATDSMLQELEQLMKVHEDDLTDTGKDES